MVWASNRNDARHEIYLRNARGDETHRLTTGGGEFPLWAPDGRWIAYRHTSDDSAHIMRWDGSEDRKVCDGLPVVWLHDNSGLVCNDGLLGFEGGSRAENYYLVNPETGVQTLLFRRSDFAHLKDDHLLPGQRHLIVGGITHDGRWMLGWVFDLFRQTYRADNGEHRGEHATAIFDLLDPTKIFFFGPGCTSTTPPSGDLIYHVSRATPTAPDIARMSIDDLYGRDSYDLELGVADEHRGHEYFPRVSTDGQWLAYGASLGGHQWDTEDYDIYLHRLDADTTERTRITEHPANDHWPHLYVGPLWQPSSEPRLLVTPSRLVVWVQAGSSVSRTLTVSNSGGGQLGEISLGLSPDEATTWIDLPPKAQGQTVSLVVNSEGLSAGSHETTVRLSASDATNSPEEVTITAMVLAPPGTDAQPGDGSPGDGSAGDGSPGDGSPGHGDAGPSLSDGSTAAPTNATGCSTSPATTPPWAVALLLATLWGTRRRRTDPRRTLSPF